MPIQYNSNTELSSKHSDDVQDIVNAVPAWLLRWGITVFFFVIAIIISLSALIKYPDIVKTNLIVMSPDKPKQVVAKIPGKLIALLVTNDEQVGDGQTLGYIESTANHSQVLALFKKLKLAQKQFLNGEDLQNIVFSIHDQDELGELQSYYQSFIQSYINYKATLADGLVLKRRAFLEKDIIALNKQTLQLKGERALLERDLSLAQEEFKVHQKLEQQKVETPAELRQQESKYISRKTPLLQNSASLISASTNLLAKQKDIMELNNQVIEEKSKFAQSLNSLISQIEDWRSKYVLMASQRGRVSYAGIIQKNQVLSSGQDVFYINTGNDNFFGLMNIPQENLGKVKAGQEVLVKLKGYPFEQYGMLHGKISYLADVPYKDSIFMSKVDFDANTSTMKNGLKLKQGMAASAEVITEDATVFQRLVRNITRSINTQ